MQSAQMLNLGPRPGAPTEDPQRKRLDHQEELQDSHERRLKILSVLVGVLIVGLIASMWFAYPTLRDQRRAVGQMIGLQAVATALGERVTTLDARLHKTAADMPDMTNRIGQLQTGLTAGLQTARTQAQTAASQMGQRIRQDLNQTLQGIQSRLAGVESNQRESTEHVVQLQAQLNKLQGEITGLREEASAANDKVKQLEEQQQSSSSALTSLDKKISTSQSTLATLTTRFDQTRVEFDVPKGKTQEIAPNIYLTVRRADVGKQEMDGALQLAANSKMLPLRQQGLSRPVTFYSTGETRPSEMVITKVSKNGVSGYVLMPMTQ